MNVLPGHWEWKLAELAIHKQLFPWDPLGYLPDEIVDQLPSPIDRSSKIQRTLDSWNDASGGGGGGGGAAASTMPLPSLSFRMNDPLQRKPELL